ncbi:hypothetical protein K457DRAFT_1875873 [Linnemannia elongata AG-77]|uniref:Uncharacterized protein n=1 Tax=Linnemannia elongata AG-77 TaxID=1314771 RepID=A0A197JY33_9FUNG|nr:hypothetical protein K457DRAFT_1875873 [Linnemannia elongata AG-77]
MSAVTSAAPISVPDNDSNFGGGVNAANNWKFDAEAVCQQEVAVVPVLGDYVSEHFNNYIIHTSTRNNII